MKQRSTITYLLILIGGSITIYANANKKQDVILLIAGIFTLMFGLFRLNKYLTSNPPKNDYKIKDEEE